MSLFGTIFISKRTKYHSFKIRRLNDTFCISKKTNMAFHTFVNVTTKVYIDCFNPIINYTLAPSYWIELSLTEKIMAITI